jgi:hypothetical protein
MHPNQYRLERERERRRRRLCQLIPPVLLAFAQKPESVLREERPRLYLAGRQMRLSNILNITLDVTHAFYIARALASTLIFYSAR